MKCLGFVFCIVNLFMLAQGCKHDCKGCSPDIPLASNLVGKWQWIKTVTPTQTITPTTTGYNQDFNFANDGSAGDYISFYRNDTIQLKLQLNRSGLVQEDKVQNTVLLPFGNQYIKFFLKKDNQNFFGEVETSQLMSQYQITADTIRSFYKYVGVPRKQ